MIFVTAGLGRLSHSAALWVALIIAIFILLPDASAASRVQEFLGKAQPADFFAGATRFGSPQGEPALVPAYQGDRLLGYVYLNADVTSATGYSGKPIHMLVGIGTNGVVSAVKLVDHKEPIVLIGIPEQRIVAAMNKLIGVNMNAVAAAARDVDQSQRETRGWEDLLGDGSVRRLALSVGDVNEAFQQAGKSEAAANSETADPADSFIDLYVAPVSVPTIGQSLLGEAGYEQLKARLKPGQHAILVAGEGAYSFKGSGYVRGGIFDRIELLQDGQSVRFRDRDHTRLGAIAAEGAPSFREIALFVIAEDFKLDMAEPWQLQLLVQRNVGARDKAFLPYHLSYTLPEKYLSPVRGSVPAPVQPAPPPSASPANETDATAANEIEEPLWLKIWKGNVVSIGITAAGLLVLTAIFFFQDALVRRPTAFVWVRRAYLTFTLIWLGWYANAQLSVVNVLTFTNSLITEFQWEFFLAAPLIFILWAAIAAALLFWGRGPFCGWLCPFGALQELTNNIAQWLKVPQVKIPWGLHERLWPIKYIIFLGLFGLSLYSVALAEVVAEVEPFKTAIILKFVRDWPFVIYALTLLSIGLFIERFFCRYLCPLGAALAIPGRMRTFEWLKRWPECGSPCQRCAKECPVQAIHPEGQINVNECIYCMHCQELYHDDHRCPHMIQVRLKREKRIALSSPSVREIKDPGSKAPRTVFSHAGETLADTPANNPTTAP